MTNYTCKQCGEEADGWEQSYCEICSKEGALCCVMATFIARIGQGLGTDMYFCKGCEKEFSDIFLETLILPSYHPNLAYLDGDELDIAQGKLKDCIRKIMEAMPLLEMVPR